jgi:hypothetical protein
MSAYTADIGQAIADLRQATAEEYKVATSTIKESL